MFSNLGPWDCNSGHRPHRVIGFHYAVKPYYAVLYQGLVEPHFRFCCSVWGTCGVTTRCTLEKLQNRAIRIITDSPFDAPAKPLLRQLRLPSIAELIRQESAGVTTTP